MSPNVRRLVFDFSPLWRLLIGFIGLIVLLMNALWLFNPKFSMPLALAFAVGPPVSGLLAAKLQIWNLLPVTRAEIARGQWWLSVGGPVVVLCVAMAIPYAVLGLVGRLHATPLDALTFLAGQMVVAIAYPTAIVVAQKLSGSFALAMAVGGLLFAGGIIGGQGLRIDPAAGGRLPFLLAGAVAVIIVAASYRRTEPFVPNIGLMGKTVNRNPRTSRQLSLKGWTSLAPSSLLIAAGESAGVVVVYLGFWRFGPHGSSPPDLAPFMASMLICSVPMIIAMRLRLSLRALRSVGGGCLSLTARVQTAVLLTQATALAALYLTIRAVGGPAAGFPALALVLLGTGSCFVPMSLRISTPLWLGLSMPLMVLVTMPAGFLVAARPGTLPFVMAAGTLLLFAGWYWTWWELARGRHAYRSWPMTPQVWRSIGN